MPDVRKHRGPHPEDHRLFGPSARKALRQAAADLAWLLDRGYALNSSLKLVGDRYELRARQRLGLARAVCAWEQVIQRHKRLLPLEHLQGKLLLLDGYNVLLTIEAALAGGVVLHCRDSTVRDMASVHGSYRRVAETVPALELLGRFLHSYQVREVRWFLDRPVSNSGRLKQLILQVAQAHCWPWSVELVFSPDGALCEAQDSQSLVASSDAAVLDRCGLWVNLNAELIPRCVPEAFWVDLDPGEPGQLNCPGPKKLRSASRKASEPDPKDGEDK